MDKKIKSLSVYRKNVVLKSSTDDALEDEEFLISESLFEPAFGKLVKETQYNGDGQVEQVMSYTYNEKGFLTGEELLDVDGSVLEKRSFEPDDQGRIAREFVHYADGSADRIEYAYDDAGRVVRKERYDDDDALESAENIVYEGEVVVCESVVDAEGEILSETLYIYDDNGRLAEIVSDNREEGLWFTKVYRYDDAGHRQAATTFNQEGEAVERILFENDEKGRPIQIVDENRRQRNTIRMAYDERGEIIFQEEHDLNGELVNSIERSYDADGRLLESHIVVRNRQRGISRNYSLRNEYNFFDE
jgi:YD repeat-containing protein